MLSRSVKVEDAQFVQHGDALLKIVVPTIYLLLIL